MNKLSIEEIENIKSCLLNKRNVYHSSYEDKRQIQFPNFFKGGKWNNEEDFYYNQAAIYYEYSQMKYEHNGERWFMHVCEQHIDEELPYSNISLFILDFDFTNNETVFLNKFFNDMKYFIDFYGEHFRECYPTDGLFFIHFEDDRHLLDHYFQRYNDLPIERLGYLSCFSNINYFTDEDMEERFREKAQENLDFTLEILCGRLNELAFKIKDKLLDSSLLSLDKEILEDEGDINKYVSDYVALFKSLFSMEKAEGYLMKS